MSNQLENMNPCVISISIVSHGQGELVTQALADLARMANPESFEVILTKNIPEQLPFTTSDHPFPLRILQNEHPKGFGANHNAAFRQANGQFFCVMNPDIRIESDPFPALLDCLAETGAALVAPRVFSPKGSIEDSARHFPTPANLLAKALGRKDGAYRLPGENKNQQVDWIAGMFMLFKVQAYRDIGGFDEGFFLYYEDVDICVRLWKCGCRVVLCPATQVIHDARRSSRKNLRYLRWHLASLFRYLGKHWMRLPESKKQQR